MIVVDGSALFAVLLGEKEAEPCARAIAADEIVMSAGSLAESLIVTAGKDVFEPLRAFVDDMAPTVFPLTSERARSAADAYRRWGKGFHKARLNLADTFAYALAKELDCPLLYIGDDFALTDIRSALD